MALAPRKVAPKARAGHCPGGEACRAARTGCVAGLLCLAPMCASAQFFTDTGSPANPAWSAILPTLNNDAPDPGPVLGSVINVNNAATETGLYGNRPISVGTQRIHVCCNTSVLASNFGNFTRWYQTDGNTQVFRLFVNDENTASTRVGAARCEAFTQDGWTRADGRTYEWTGRYTVARRQQGFAIFQVMNSDNEWAVQLNLTSTGSLLVNNRRNLADVTVKNPDGSNKDFDGEGFDVRVLDDGHTYKVWIDGVLYSENYYDRPTGTTTFRWGKYLGNNILTAPSDYSVILVSGAQVKSWPGDLEAAATTIEKANNTQNLETTTSWSGGAVPGLHNVAEWNSKVGAANTTTLAGDLDWAGLRIVNPGGLVTINGSATLGLHASGLDMDSATRSLVVNCPVEISDESTWTVAGSPTATFNGVVRGYAGITLAGGGTLILNAANTYTGPTTINAGTLQLGNGGTTGALSTASAISVASGATFEINRSDAVTQGTHFSGAPITGAGGVSKTGAGTLTLTAANTYTGSTSVSAGTLRISNAMALGTTGAGVAVSGNTGGAATNARLELSGGITVTGESATLNGNGNFLGALQSVSGVNEWTGGVTIGSSGTRIGATSGNTLKVSGVIDSSGNNHGFIVRNDATGTTILSGANTYVGNTTLFVGKLQLDGGDNRLPTATKLILGTGTSVSEFDLNGRNQEVAGLEVTAGATASNNSINNSSGTLSTLTVNTLVASPSSFSGILKGNLALTKSGADTLTLTNANTYSGPTNLNAGTLALSNAAPFQNTSLLTLSGGTLLQPTMDGVGISAPMALGAAGTTASISAPTNLPGSSATSTLALNGPISGAGHLTFTSSAAQNATSTVLLNAASTYSGDTRLDTAGTADTQIIVKLGVPNALPASTVLTIDGQAGNGTGRFAELNLNGCDQHLAGLTNVERNLRRQRIVNSSVSAAATLTIQNAGDHVFSGSLGGSASVSVSPEAMPGSAHGDNFSLTKGGTGSFTLSGTHRYAGNTTVNQGTLVLGSPNSNNQASTVTLAVTGATLHLAFAGTDTVERLFVGTTAMPAGVYAAPGSATPGIPLPQLAGTGTLTVTAGPAQAGYAVWRIINHTDQPLDGDHDGDGVMNGMEFFLGGPLADTYGATPLPGVIWDAGFLRWTWTRAADYPGVYGIDFAVETCADLRGPWLPATPGAALIIKGREVQYTFPTSAPSHFVGLRVLGPDE